MTILQNKTSRYWVRFCLDACQSLQKFCTGFWVGFLSSWHSLCPQPSADYCHNSSRPGFLWMGRVVKNMSSVVNLCQHETWVQSTRLSTKGFGDKERCLLQASCRLHLLLSNSLSVHMSYLQLHWRLLAALLHTLIERHRSSLHFWRCEGSAGGWAETKRAQQWSLPAQMRQQQRSLSPATQEILVQRLNAASQV